MIAAVSGTPAQAAEVYEAIRPNLDPTIELAPPVELPPKCKCVVPRLYAFAHANGMTVHGMTLAVYATGKKIRPCFYCWWNSRKITAGVPYVRR
jgi:hypothetical protein